MRAHLLKPTSPVPERIADIARQIGRLRGLSPLLVLTFLALPGCASRPGPEALAVVPDENSTASFVTIDVVTNRRFDVTSRSYSDLRSHKMQLERFTLSVPPNHKLTRIEWSKGDPDPAKKFVVTEREIRPTSELGTASVAAGAVRLKPGKRDVVIFVHGYNYNFQESLFRLAQLVADGGLDDAPVLFAWPSAASVTGYVADRDAITYSRDDLVHVLNTLAGQPQVGRITLFGHSMGAMLVVEALRQLRLTGQDRTIERLGDVVLAAPDIDIDVFRRQMEIIGPLDPPLTLLVAPDDRALTISARLTGSRSRLGTRDVQDPRVQALANTNGIRVIDISDVSSPDATMHSRFVGLVTVFPRMRGERDPVLVQAGAFVLEPLAAVLIPAHPR